MASGMIECTPSPIIPAPARQNWRELFKVRTSIRRACINARKNLPDCLIFQAFHPSKSKNRDVVKNKLAPVAAIQDRINRAGIFKA
jgi:hypothetical protein